MLAISIENLTAGYGKTDVLRNLSLNITEGESVAMLGPNGAGKSTFLKIVTGLLKPKTGNVRLFDKPLSAISAAQRARLAGVAPQEFKTPMPYTVEEIVTMGRTAVLNAWGGISRNDRLIVEKAMAYTDIINCRERLFDDLSGGEKQRAVIAMALAQEPRIILMDEPTSHLDINHRIEIMQIMERLNSEQGVTTLITSHDINLASEFCRRIIIMDHGEIAADGTSAETLREDILKKVYHCDIRVKQDSETGSTMILPARRFSNTASSGPAIHVVCGGGSGQEIIRRLALSGCRVSCGVLNELDTDAQVASAFGAETALEKPFSPVSADTLAHAIRISEHADCIVIAEVPFGPGNLANIEIAEKALNNGKRVVVINGLSGSRDYTPGMKAVKKIEALITKGAEQKNLSDFLQDI